MTQPPGSRAARLRSLDVLRGLAVIGMLLVNDPGSDEYVYAPLRHADWNGWSAADLVFPTFLFVVGVAIHLSLTSRSGRGTSDAALRRRIVRRGALLIAIGLALNWFPFYEFGSIAGVTQPGVLDRAVARLEVVRFMGILQRIGIAYAAAALLTWRAGTRRVVGTAATLLIGYWLLMTVVPVPGTQLPGADLLGDPARNLAAWVDRALLDWSRWGLGNHIWDGSVVFDPEGVVSTIPAIATTILGVLAGRWMASARPLDERVSGLCAAGAVAAMTGLCWNWVLPINKHIWSSSYALFTAGVACLSLGTIAWIVDMQHEERWVAPLTTLGTSAIVAFVGSELGAIFMTSTVRMTMDGHAVSAATWIYAHLAFAVDERSASALYAAAFTAAWYPVLRALERRGIVIRI